MKMQANLNIGLKKTNESFNSKTHTSYIFILKLKKNTLKWSLFEFPYLCNHPGCHYSLVANSLNFNITLHLLIHSADLY